MIGLIVNNKELNLLACAASNHFSARNHSHQISRSLSAVITEGTFAPLEIMVGTTDGIMKLKMDPPNLFLKKRH
jgi:hypothetical protein